MADYQLQSSKFHKESTFSSIGIIVPSDGHKLYGEQLLRVKIENAANNNQVVVKGKLIGSSSWSNIYFIDGSGYSENIDISGYDVIRFEIVRYEALDGYTPKLIASAFFSLPNSESAIIAAISQTNDLLLDINSKLQKIYNKQLVMELQIQEITGENLSEDI